MWHNTQELKHDALVDVFYFACEGLDASSFRAQMIVIRDPSGTSFHPYKDRRLELASPNK